MKKPKKITLSIFIFIFGIAIAFASSNFIKHGDNWDAGQIEGSDSANDIWTITGSIDIEDSNSNDYINNGLRGKIKNYTINSTLFGNFNNSLTPEFKFYESNLDSDASKCGTDALEAYKFKSGNKIKSESWGILEIDETKSYICSNQYVNLKFKSPHLKEKTIGDGTIASNDVFGKQQININGILNGNTGTGILARGDQNTLNLDTSNSKKVLFKTNINKNISKIFLTYNEEIIRNSYNINSDIANSGDKDKYYLYDYTGKTETDYINKYDGNNYINQGKNLTIGNSGVGITRITGKNTIIVKSGNIYINSNLDNNDDKKDLLILIAKRDENTGNGGNIYIDPDVTNIDAILVADGSLISYKNGIIQGPGFNANNIRKQLLIYGSVISSNNIGTDKIPYGADYYQKFTNNIMNKNIYDLGNLRTFNLNYGKNSYSECFDENKLVPIDGNGGYIKNAWAGRRDCYSDDSTKNGLRGTNKTNPLIIEYNSNITEINPYIMTNNN